MPAGPCTITSRASAEVGATSAMYRATPLLTLSWIHLKTKGKARGYVERVEATGSGGGPIKIDIETVRNARQRNLELVEEVARRLASGAAGAPAGGGTGESPEPDEPNGGC